MLRLFISIKSKDTLTMSFFSVNGHTCFSKKYNNRQTISIVTERYTPGRFWRMAVKGLPQRYSTPRTASEVSLGLYKSQSQTERLLSLTFSEQSYTLNFCYLTCKTTHPLPDYQSIVTVNSLGYLLSRTRFRKSKKLYFWSKLFCCRTNYSGSWIEAQLSLVNTRFLRFISIINSSNSLFVRLNCFLICFLEYPKWFLNYPETEMIKSYSSTN